MTGSKVRSSRLKMSRPNTLCPWYSASPFFFKSSLNPIFILLFAVLLPLVSMLKSDDFCCLLVALVSFRRAMSSLVSPLFVRRASLLELFFVSSSSSPCSLPFISFAYFSRTRRIWLMSTPFCISFVTICACDVPAFNSFWANAMTWLSVMPASTVAEASRNRLRRDIKNTFFILFLWWRILVDSPWGVYAL